MPIPALRFAYAKLQHILEWCKSKILEGDFCSGNYVEETGEGNFLVSGYFSWISK